LNDSLITQLTEVVVNERQTLTELRVICAIREWKEPTHQAQGLTEILQNQSWRVETNVLERMITKRRDPGHQVSEIPK